MGTGKLTHFSMLPKQLDEEVARAHCGQLGIKLTQLSKDQSEYIGLPVEGPYKPEHYVSYPVLHHVDQLTLVQRY